MKITVFPIIAPSLSSLGVGHSGGSTSTPSEALGILKHSEGLGAGTVGQEADSAAEENSAPSLQGEFLGRGREKI